MTVPPRRSSLFGDLSALFSTSLLSRLFAGVIGLFLPDYLGPTDQGILRPAIELSFFVFFLTDLGFNQILVREMSRSDESRHRALVWTSLRSRFTLTVLVTLATLLFASSISKDPHVVQTVQQLVFWSAIPGMLIAWVEAVLNSTHRVAISAYVRFAATIAVGVATLLTMLTHGRITEYVIFQSLGNWIVAIPCLIWVLRQYPWDPKVESALFNGLWTFAALGVLTILMPRIAAWVLPNDLPQASTGAYFTAYNIPSTLSFIALNIGQAFFPRQSAAWAKSAAEHARITLSYLRLSSLITGIIALGVALFAAPTVQILYSKYTAFPMVWSMVCLALIPWLMGLSQPTSNGLASCGMQGKATAVLVVTTFASIALFLVLPARYGMMGAVAATIGTEITRTLGNLLVMPKSSALPATLITLRQTMLLLVAFGAGYTVQQVLQMPALLESLLASFVAVGLFVLGTASTESELRDTLAGVLGRFRKTTNA